MENQNPKTYIENGFQVPNFNGAIIHKLVNGGYVGNVTHRGEIRFVVYNDEGKCFDIYGNHHDAKSKLIQWDRYNLKKEIK